MIGVSPNLQGIAPDFTMAGLANDAVKWRALNVWTIAVVFTSILNHYASGFDVQRLVAMLASAVGVVSFFTIVPRNPNAIDRLVAVSTHAFWVEEVTTALQCRPRNAISA